MVVTSDYSPSDTNDDIWGFKSISDNDKLANIDDTWQGLTGFLIRAP